MDIWLKPSKNRLNRISEVETTPGIAANDTSDNLGIIGEATIGGMVETAVDAKANNINNTIEAANHIKDIDVQSLADNLGEIGEAKIKDAIEGRVGETAQKIEDTLEKGQALYTKLAGFQAGINLAHNKNRKAANDTKESPKEPSPPAYTAGDIQFHLPVAIEHIIGLRIEQALNDHVVVYLTGRAPDTLAAKDIEQIGDKALIELSLPGQNTPFFTGRCTAINLEYQAGFHTVEIEGKSWTYELDIVKKRRSFQKLGISYEEFMSEVLADYREKAFINALPGDNKYIQFAVQYYDTDWELSKRVAAREGTVLVPEYKKTGQKPSFWLGLPNMSAEPLYVPAAKSVCRDHQNYQWLSANLDDSVQEKDFVTYEMESYAFYPLGQKVEYEGKTLTVVRCITELKKELIQNTYTLAYSEKIALASPENTNIKGVALAGKVLNSRGVNSKIHLDIDKTQEEADAIWFPYANETGNMFYCMPHNGETVNLYFKDGYEDNAIAMNGARKNGGSCKKTGDYNNRYFTNNERKELFLSPDTVSFTVDESAAEKIAIKMTNDGGILIESTKDICLNALQNITFEADEGIIMESGKAAGGSA
ncbi:MAG: hypothetical protein LLG02_09910 [Pelosinus sp.]|nr:hypothetical protein [Pelosinus sp.]